MSGSRPIDIRTDMGNAVEATGHSADDRVIDNPPDSLRDGDPVKPSPEPATAKRPRTSKMDASCDPFAS